VAPLFLFNKEKAIYFFFSFAGPSFIKLGQLLSVRADLVGKEIALTLTKFQDSIAPFSQKKLSNNSAVNLKHINTSFTLQILFLRAF
jgi:predicted unusual protein kinase regulating ubiquinone biosynthesis (AarF/ABC1/UbiB family)